MNLRNAVALAAGVLMSAAAPHARALDPGAGTFAITEADDYHLGRQYVSMMEAFGRVNADPEAADEVRQIVARVVAASDRPDIVYGVYVLDASDPNAMALPGGFMVVHTGILKVMNRDELTFVLGHELAHVQLRHFATTRNIEQALADVRRLSSRAGSGSAPAVGTDAAGVAAALDARRIQLSYSRQLEFEADLYGMLFALRAGAPLSAGVSAMQKLKQVAGEVPAPLRGETTHPSFADRVAQLQRGAENIRGHHALFAQGVALARAGSLGEAVSAFERFLKVFPRSAAAWSNLGAAHLALALAESPPRTLLDELWDDVPWYDEPDVRLRALDLVRGQEAERALRQALAVDPNRAHAWASLSVLLRRSGRGADARKAIDLALTLDPRWSGYAAILGNLEATEGRWKEAFAAWRKADTLAGSPLATVARNRALAFESKGDKKRAAAQWRELLDLPGHRAAAERHLGVLGEPGQAPASAGPEVAGAPGAPGTADEDVAVLSGGVAGAEEALAGTRIGEEREAVVARLGPPDEANPLPSGGVEILWYGARGISLLLLDGAVESVTVSNAAGGGTARGLNVGDPRTRIEALYGTAEGAYEDPDGGSAVYSYPSCGIEVGVLDDPRSPGPDPKVHSITLLRR